MPQIESIVEYDFGKPDHPNYRETKITITSQVGGTYISQVSKDNRSYFSTEDFPSFFIRVN